MKQQMKQNTATTEFTSRRLTVEFMDGGAKPETRTFECTPEQGSTVNAGALKDGFLKSFDVTSPLLEAEASADENQSYHLVGIDEAGARTSFGDDQNVDLGRYNRFEVVPRTVGGSGRRL